MNVAIGWRFYSADFSINARDPQAMAPGTVILIREPAQREAWNKLSDSEKTDVELFVYGKGVDFHTALQDANSAAASESSLLTSGSWTYEGLKGNYSD